MVSLLTARIIQDAGAHAVLDLSRLRAVGRLAADRRHDHVLVSHRIEDHAAQNRGRRADRRDVASTIAPRTTAGLPPRPPLLGVFRAEFVPQVATLLQAAVARLETSWAAPLD